MLVVAAHSFQRGVSDIEGGKFQRAGATRPFVVDIMPARGLSESRLLQLGKSKWGLSNGGLSCEAEGLLEAPKPRKNQSRQKIGQR